MGEPAIQNPRDGFFRQTFGRVDLRGDELMPTLAEQWADRGRAKGLQEGLEKGRQQGRYEGRQEGRQEGTYIGTIQTCRSILGDPNDSSD
jgi:recombination-promoting nuclease RpnB